MVYTDEEKRWIWLSSIEGIGPKRFSELLSVFEDPEGVWEASERDLYRMPFINRKVIKKLIECRNEDYIEDFFTVLDEKKITAIAGISPYYPESLTSIYDPPPVLYIKGNLDVLEKRMIAIVGSRRCTGYGQTVSEQIGRDLAMHGVAVVSGMARGIDTCAHMGCLSAGGETIAVLGCGVDIHYPPENRKLYQQIQERGAIISEYLPGTQPLAQHFPARNRIISGLTSGVVVIEAGERSGALITVDFALEQGREVFAIPGNILSKYSIGCNRLIREGAKIVTDVYDILEEFDWERRAEQNISTGGERNIQLDIDEAMVVAILDEEDASFDELVKKSGLSAQKINSLLTMLELRGIIKQLPGKIFSKQ